MKILPLFLRKRRPAPAPARVRADDLFIASYPRSGNNWHRFLVANLLRPAEAVTFESIRQIVPDIHQSSDDDLERLPSPRVMKSHATFTPRYPKSIYVVRDPRSVAVSVHQFLISHQKLPENHSVSAFIPEFVRGRYFRKFLSWGENVGSWVSQVDQGNRSILLLRYEDAKANPVAQLRRVADFLAIQRTDAELEKAVERSSFEQMQVLERQRDATNPRHARDAKRPLVRKGKLNEWQSVLSPADCAVLREAFEKPMSRMGYN